MNRLIVCSKTVIIVLALFLSGCATVVDLHNPPPSDFPELTIVSHYVSQEEMAAFCQKFAPPGVTAMACAMPDYDRMVCDIRYGGPFAVAMLKEHEELHCKGYDHPGESTIRDSWGRYKQRKK